MGRILALVLIFYSLSFGQKAKNILNVDEPGKAILKTFAMCEYKLVLKDPKDKEIKIGVTQIGNSWFAGSHGEKFDYIVTVNHLIKCDSTIVELEQGGILDKYDKIHDEDLRITNVIGLKDGQLKNISAYTFEGIPVRDIKILFDSPVSGDDADKALLGGVVDENVFHNHFILMEDGVFDEIFYKNGIGKAVVVRGFFSLDGGWRFRYKTLEIESLWPEVFQASGFLNSSLSGNPVTYFHDDRLYAIGIAASVEKNVPDMAYVTIVKKSFLEKRNKK
ncbi:MAG: hypothetical protein AAB556_02175 [Patescibacteria group bacterium]